VLAHYLARFPRRHASPEQAKIVAKALLLGYTASDLCEAIDGNASDEWHVARRKHELSYVLRNAEIIDSMRAKLETDDEPIVDAQGCLTAYGERLTRPANG
jgi:hypothetical protein